MLRKTDKFEFQSLLEDTSNLKGGNAETAAFPQSIDEAAQFIKECNSTNSPLTISAGGTGTTGARIPFGGEILSAQNLNKIIDIRKNTGGDSCFIVVQPGVLWQDFKKEVEKAGLWFGPDPTEDKAFVGGAIATNASGARSFKYGSIRNHVRRLKVVLTSGEIIEIKRGEAFAKNRQLPLNGKVINLPSYTTPPIKCSAGYFVKDNMDLIDLFIGQEGTLAFVAEIEIALTKKPEQIIGFFAFFDKQADALNFAADAKKQDCLSIEFFDKPSLSLMNKTNNNIPAESGGGVYIEQETTLEGQGAVMEDWLKLLDKYRVSENNIWFSDNPKQEKILKDLRHSIPEHINEMIRQNKMVKVASDIAVPDKGFNEMMEFYLDKLRPSGLEFMIFGHIGNNHLHANMMPKSETELAKAKSIYMDFVRKAVSLGGTCSAEHGIGKIKHQYLEEMFGHKGILEMASLKKSIDPNRILGVDNIFDKSLLI